MASGQKVGHIKGIRPPRATAAYPVEIAGGSTPSENIIAWSFIDTAISYLDFLVFLAGYGGGGLTIHFAHGTQSGTLANPVRIGVAVRRVSDDNVDLDTSHSYVYTDGTFTTASAREEWAYDTIALTNGAAMDNWANLEWAYVRVRRQPADAADTLGGIWHMQPIAIVET